MKDLNVSQEVALLGVTLYVIGFGSGSVAFTSSLTTLDERFLCNRPLLFAPLSEVNRCLKTWHAPVLHSNI